METLNKATLLNLYIEWNQKYGDGRNEKDLRFGQWIWIYFDDQLRELQSIKQLPNDGFGTESAKKAYELISKYF